MSFDGFRVDHETGGVLLTDEAFRIFIKKYEKKMRSESSYLSASGRKNYRALLNEQVSMLARAIDNEDVQLYKAIRIR